MTPQAASPRPRVANRSGGSKGGSSKGRGRGRSVQKGLSAAAVLGFTAALLTLVLDQATKLYTLFVYDLPVREPVELAPFVNLIVVWNRGISYGLFQQSSEVGRWGLIVISILAAIGLSFWIRRTTAKLLAVSLGLIVGGAIGNVIDRLAYGAVFDFIQIHVGTWSWYVFNVADAAIVAGVVGLLYDSFVLEGRRAK
ncbi:signal peptidase II [Microvirga sp. HBU67558]|nr:signal peptidase II [Microvirga sp. HBU67558]